MKAGHARGEGLLESGQRFGRMPGLAARLFAPAVSRIVEKIDAGLASGAIHATLPDGTKCTLGGNAPGFECDVTLHDWRALLRLATGGSVGWYQAWEAGEWSSPDPVPLFALFMANAVTLGDAARAKGPWRLAARAMHALKRNTRSGAEKNIHAHYDLGNDFYACWLDPTMTYSSGKWFAEEGGLEASQRRKWQALSKRIGKADSVLEIGCGWGSLAGHLAGEGRDVTAISLSDSQLEWAREHNVGPDYRKCDYRDMTGQFDAIVSVEMVEALGREYWPTFMDCVARNLRPGGRAAIQYISIADPIYDSYAASADFIQAYVFPGGMLIRTSEFRRLALERGLRWSDQRDFGQDYAETLKSWRQRFDAAHAQGRLPDDFDKRFRDLWRYYLMYCEGGFRGGGIDVHQVTLVKDA
ncbi:SAM-dependent methyltransferase [Aurantiacibacter zhengii]|uniref:Class I SAM-dependent methyltransferase n=1 Tax=Aurantiacibacter zhengii TaxID=2307003 RepID=A0A418NWN9_9SPHN|nr:cyclopropane-fatty-acyl-phospholipid synthase family protein [Aurantiacibacter zhengii]RIV89013.1 class I SAM-dependent methyltransferase [Aurantiacibacter zhengii]